MQEFFERHPCLRDEGGVGRDAVDQAGIDAARINAVGYGEEKPIASNETAEGKAQNRRIEMTVK